MKRMARLILNTMHAHTLRRDMLLACTVVILLIAGNVW